MPDSKPVFRQSAVIPFRKSDGKTEILLIRNRSNRRWIIPKGIIEPGLTAQESAAQEALEEAGVTGTVMAQKVGEYQYNKWGGICQVQVFLMRVETILDDWLESQRQRKWFSPQLAAENLHETELRKMVKTSRFEF